MIKKIKSKAMNSFKMFNLMKDIYELKWLYRQGWIKAGVKQENCESVADHIFGVVMLSWALVEEHFTNLDLNKVIQLSLVHELGEIFAGDIIPSDNVSKKAKFDIEKESVERVVSRLSFGDKFLDLWLEFEEEKTPEAKFVKQIDKLEMSFQAKFYENQFDLNLEGFYRSSEKQIDDEYLLKLLNEIEL